MSRKTLLPTRVFTMPALPPAAARTLQLLQHVRVEPVQIVRIMESDPEWTAEVLRLAGSPVWGRTGAPADLNDAIGVLGLRRFYQLVAVSAVGPLLKAPLSGYGLGEGELWNHSLAVAIATREILLEKGLKPCEEAFTAALLHDVGKLLLGSALETDPDADFLESEDEAATSEEVEHRAAGMDHAEAGGLLLEHWKMPYWLVTAVRSHHAPTESSFLIADLVHLADALCLSAGVGAGRDGLRHRVSPDVSQRWNFPKRSLERILGRTLDGLADARDLRVVGVRR